MKIYSRKHIAQGVPILPMLDILTILLIFFIVHTELKNQVRVLELDLPQTHALTGNPGESNSVLLELAATGELAFNGKMINHQEISAAIHEIKAERPDVQIQFSAAEGVALGRLIEIYDSVSSAGIEVQELNLMIKATPQD